jgi:hypothetical protein
LDLEGSSDRRFVLEFETGAIWQSRNQIQVPDSADGTRFDLTDLQGHGPEAHRRVELTWNVNHRHALRFVYAPIGFSRSGSFPTPVRFARGTFSASPVDSDYKFDSDRLTYRYMVYETDGWRWRIGATAFIRDAKVRLRQAGRVASDSPIGFGPLAQRGGRICDRATLDGFDRLRRAGHHTRAGDRPSGQDPLRPQRCLVYLRRLSCLRGRRR